MDPLVGYLRDNTLPEYLNEVGRTNKFQWFLLYEGFIYKQAFSLPLYDEDFRGKQEDFERDICMRMWGTHWGPKPNYESIANRILLADSLGQHSRNGKKVQQVLTTCPFYITSLPPQ